MKAIHFYCRQHGIAPENYERRGEPGSGCLGWWDISEAKARDLIGGWAYLHHPSTIPSYQAHRITGIEPGTDEWSGRIGFQLSIVPEVKSVRWRGPVAQQNPKHNYRVVDADLPHEKASA